MGFKVIHAHHAPLGLHLLRSGRRSTSATLLRADALLLVARRLLVTLDGAFWGLASEHSLDHGRGDGGGHGLRHELAVELSREGVNDAFCAHSPSLSLNICIVEEKTVLNSSLLQQ